MAVLKQELQREREHGFREMRELRVGCEDAEARAAALERQVVYLRCSEWTQNCGNTTPATSTGHKTLRPWRPIHLLRRQDEEGHLAECSLPPQFVQCKRTS